jgi:hypothetical protein
MAPSIKLPPALLAKLQAFYNKVPHWVSVAFIAFAAAAADTLRTANWSPEIADLVAGNVGAAVRLALPTLGIALGAGFGAWSALLKTSFLDKSKVQFADHVDKAMAAQRVSEEVTPQGRPVSVSPPALAGIPSSFPKSGPVVIDPSEKK